VTLRAISALLALALLAAGCQGSEESAHDSTLPVQVAMLPGLAQFSAEPAAAGLADPVLSLQLDAEWSDEDDEVTVQVLRRPAGEGSGGDPEVVVDEVAVPAEGAGVPVPAEDGHGNGWRYSVRRTDDGEPVGPETGAVDASRLPWKPVFEDEFGDDTLSDDWVVPKTWHRETCASPVESDAQNHNRNRLGHTRKLVRPDGGVAVVGISPPARSETCPDGRRLRTSGHVGTERRLFGSGKRYVFAARVKMPSTAGNYAAFWIRGVGPTTKKSTARYSHYEDQGEVDVVESFGADPSASCAGSGDLEANGVTRPDWSGLQANMYFNFHAAVGGYKHCLSREEVARVPGMAERAAWDDYHVYSVEWAPDEYYRIRWDGVVVKTFTGEDYTSRRASYLILSNLIGDGKETYRGPDSQLYVTRDGHEYDPGPAYLTQADASAMKVDWVRAWEHTP
jgi:hypothetical protein